MKKNLPLSILSFLTLLSCTTQLNAEELKIFGVNLQVTAECKLKVSQNNKSVKNIELSIPNSNCKFIKHADTNVIHIERVSNAYMVLVESTKTENGKCISNYSAIVVNNKGMVEASKLKKRSGTCHVDRERKVFDYFAHKMNILK